jgi:ATP-binding cassette subfamily F protein 3
MIQISQVSKSFGPKALFRDVTFNIERKERIGLVGRNGTGKTTLFKIIAGLESSDSGTILVPNGYKIGHLQQHLNFTEDTVIEECVSALSEEQKFDHYLAEKILMGLGFSEEDFKRSPSEFSGGYQIRINLVKLILEDPDFLLLDEPTNYLDIVSLRWLANFLKTFKGEVLLITHDRSFMDSVVTHVAGIRRGLVKKIKGKTAKYYEQIVSEEEIHEQTRLNIERKKKELMLFVEKNRAKASKASLAQSKLKQAEKLESMEQLEAESSMSLKFNYSPCQSKEIFKASDISFGYGEDPNLFEDISFSLGPSEKLAIIGKNGKGKSTLLNTLAGELNARSGETKVAPTGTIAHFGQTNIDRLHPNNTIEQEIYSANSDLSKTEVRSICGSMMFSADDAEKLIKVLSGGERARVLLGKLLANPANILFLDEPTNHLDIESIEVLLSAMKNYPGAILLVTHNERIIRELATRLVIFRKDGAEYFFGNYDDFLEKVGWDEEEVQKKEKAPKEKSKSPKNTEQKNKTLAKKLAGEIEQLEGVIDGLEKLVKIKESELATAPGEKLHELSSEIGELHQKIEALFDKLEQKSNELLEVESTLD